MIQDVNVKQQMVSTTEENEIITDPPKPTKTTTSQSQLGSSQKKSTITQFKTYTTTETLYFPGYTTYTSSTGTNGQLTTYATYIPPSTVVVVKKVTSATIEEIQESNPVSAGHLDLELSIYNLYSIATSLFVITEKIKIKRNDDNPLPPDDEKPKVPLVYDCLALVFKHLSNDIKTLHSCLLLNKHCCELVVPILWKAPFSNNMVSSTIIASYLKCLSKHETSNLSRYYVKLPDNNNRPMTFAFLDYPKHLEDLNMKNLHLSVENWIEKTQTSKLSIIVCHRHTKLIIRTICRMILVKSKKFKSIKLDWNYPRRKSREKLKFLHCKNSAIFLSQLKELSISYVPKKGDLLMDLAKHSTNLRRLELIDNTFNTSNRNGSISELIKKQKNLEYLKIFSYGTSLTDQISALKCSFKTLKSFELIYAKFTTITSEFNHLSKCSNLEILILDHCEFSDEGIIQPLRNLSKLTKLHIKNSFRGLFEIFMDLLNSNSKTLKDIYYVDDQIRRDIFIDERLYKTLCSKYKNTLNRISLPYKHDSDTKRLLINFLNNNSENLISLKLFGSYKYTREFSDFMPQLFNILPPRLRNISLDMEWGKRDAVILESVLRNCKGDLDTFYISSWSRSNPGASERGLIEEYLRYNNRQLNFQEFVLIQVS
ncbi:13792_t:CDS:2 [Entrophospora sp. SA101]|nr:13792_t:CDS:2 [Entrophospora sp. SA101]